MLADFDRHILTELIILSEKERRAAVEFKHQWEIITSVRDKTELIVLGQKDAEHPELPKLRNQIFRAMKVCNTKMIVMDDAMSRSASLLNHLVSKIEESDTKKGTETNVGTYTPNHSLS